MDWKHRDFTVIYRIRPLFTPKNSYTIENSQNSIHSTAGKQFYAHAVYGPESESSQIYSECIKNSLFSAMDGSFMSVLCYGQTNAGKTFTIQELAHCISKEAFQDHLLVHLTVIEIFGNQIVDLLTEIPTRGKIMEDIQGKVQFMATSQFIESSNEVLHYLKIAFLHRKTQSTFKNDQSSRSHAIFRLSFTFKNDKNAMKGVFQLIDLAGSERAATDSIHHSSERLKETVLINTSLMTLKECIRQRAFPSVKLPHIPYRGSKLTLALKEPFELSSRQPCHTFFIACLSPEPVDLSATLNTLRYASSLYSAPQKLNVQPSLNDVSFWNCEQVQDWLRRQCGEIANVSIICPDESEFHERCLNASNGKLGGKRAESIYLKFWDLIVQSRLKARKLLEEEWKRKRREKLNDLEMYEQMSKP